MYTITSEVIRALTLESAVSLGHFHILKLWIDEYVGIVAGRHAMLAATNKVHIQSPSIPDYSPLMIQVPSGNQDQFGSNQATAVPVPVPPSLPPASQFNLAGGTGTDMDLGSYDSSIDYSSINNLGTPFNFQPAATPRQ